MARLLFLFLFFALSYSRPGGRARDPEREKKRAFEAAMNPDKAGRGGPPRGGGPKRPMGVKPTLHKFDITDSDGNVIRLDEENFPGVKVFLIINTATECGFASQFKGLEQMYQNLKDKGLEIIAFPSDSFNQEPLETKEIVSTVKEKYGVTFPIMSKCEVNGDNQEELFKFLKATNVRKGEEKVPDWHRLEDSGLHPLDIHWNFEKFLVFTARGSQRVLRFPYDTTPEDLEGSVKRAINAASTEKREL